MLRLAVWIVIAVGFCSLAAGVQSTSRFAIFMWVYMLPLARHKVMVFLDDWFISVGFYRASTRLPPITNGLAYIAAPDKNKGHQSCKPKFFIKMQADYNMLMVMPINLLRNPQTECQHIAINTQIITFISYQTRCHLIIVNLCYTNRLVARLRHARSFT